MPTEMTERRLSWKSWKEQDKTHHIEDGDTVHHQEDRTGWATQQVGRLVGSELLIADITVHGYKVPSCTNYDSYWLSLEIQCLIH